MARRRDGIDPMAFVTQQEGDGGLKDLGVLMGLLGLGPGEEEEGRLAKGQQAQQAYYEGMIGQQAAAGGRAEQELADRRAEAKAAGEERLAAAALRKLQEQELIDARSRDIQYKEDTLAQTAMEKALEGVNDPKERQAIIGNFNPRAAAAFQKGEEAKKGIATGRFKKGLEQAYKTAGEKGRPGDVAKYLKTQEVIPGMEEIMQDPSVEWQRLNQGMPAPQPGWLSRMFGDGGAGTPAAVAPSSFRPIAPENFSTPLSGSMGMAAAPQLPPVPPPVDKVMEVAGVTGRNAAPPFVYEPGGPSAMPGVVQQPGFLENFLKQISDYTASRPERVPVERYPYPIGHGVPPTVGGPIDPRLLQP